MCKPPALLVSTNRGLSVLAFFCLFLDPCAAQAGCAVAIEIDGNSVRCRESGSSTPKGGSSFFTGKESADAVMQLCKNQGLTQARVVYESDLTGYFALAYGKNASNTIVTAVGQGPTQDEADKLALEQLKAVGGTFYPSILTRWFSYGEPASDSTGTSN